MNTADRTAALRATRAKDSHDKRQRALAAIAQLEAAGRPVTASAVATIAGVSSWLVYADGVREHLDAARGRQAEHGLIPAATMPDTKAPLTPASLRTDLAIAREQIRQLRAERDQLRARLRLQLGAEIDGPERAELITRVAELEATGRRLATERDARAAEAVQAQRHARELEDDLTAARDSLRQVIKAQNR
jgi:Family of unknown function (DUF6262)